MTVLERISYYQNQRDEGPNQALAAELAADRNVTGLNEIADHLWDRNPNVQSDCVKVLYETGYRAPELIAPYTAHFLKLLHSKNNRLVWGAMLALSTVAGLQAELICAQRETIQRAMQSGSVITRDAGVKTLAGAAVGSPARQALILPFLLDHLAHCRPKDVPQHAEQTLPAVGPAHAPAFIDLLQRRLPDLSASETQRVQRVIRKAAGAL